ncbi:MULTISPECIES: alpha/beta hydrolase [unclassified Polaribacter]|uniref:alpha/beta hydrolase n=1 Tax=unclassified Polaribacter TaxID=196858 RepID=UPI0011BD7E0F|nr:MULTISPECIES: alpha/beta hydrolase [unclassified Polaribacter]TXD51946.1 alpha/beta hydrolase [Polaribacter sp. IC063]TXD59710.1 alpha/beta hydrolase [Polaribacter sp. IC066]
MIKFITYLIISIFGITISFAQVKSEEIIIKNQAIQLAGTLTYVAQESPLIIWVHGSGPVDRNGNQPAQNIKANYIKQFREAVNAEDIAFFSYDKRTANSKNIALLKDVLITDFITDLEQVIHHFKNDTGFSEIILAGHSQGSLIAMMALENVDKYISIAGAGETIDQTLIRQITAQNPPFGKLTEGYLKELKETGEIKQVDPNLASLFAKQNQAFLASWIAIDPLKEIKKITIPALLLNGDKDVQVEVSNAQNLKKAKPDAKLVIIKNMNHVLKDIQKDEDNMKSYYSSEYPISKQLIQTILEFVKQ